MEHQITIVTPSASTELPGEINQEIQVEIGTEYVVGNKHVSDFRSFRRDSNDMSCYELNSSNDENSMVNCSKSLYEEFLAVV